MLNLNLILSRVNFFSAFNFHVVIILLLIVLCSSSKHDQHVYENCSTFDTAVDCENCVHVLVVWEELKRELIFNHSVGPQEIRDNFVCVFPEKVYEEGGVVLELWNERLREYAEMKNNTILTTDSKVNVREILNIEVNTSSGLKTITNSRSRQALRDELLKFYDKNSWPWAHMNSSCTVRVNIMFHQILDVDLAHGTLKMLVWLRLKWTDPRLTWDQQNWNDIKNMHFWQDEIWTPNIEIWNSIESIEKTLQRQLTYVDPDGRIYWSRMGELYITCDMKGLDQFPYDKSQCTLELGSWSYDMHLVDLYFHDNGYQLDKSLTSGKYSMFAQYNIDSVNVRMHQYPPVDTYPGDPYTWKTLHYYVIFSRHHMQYTYGIILPQVLLTFLSFAAFFLPPSSDERIGFTVTIPLAIAVYKLLMYEQLPASKELVYAQKISFGCFMFSMVVVMESVFVVMLWQRTDAYLFSPFRSLQKFIVDFKEMSDWANLVRAVDLEMTNRKIEFYKNQRSFNLSKKISLYAIRLMGSVKLYKNKLQIEGKEKYKNDECELQQVHATKLEGTQNQPENEQNNFHNVQSYPDFLSQVESQQSTFPDLESQNNSSNINIPDNSSNSNNPENCESEKVTFPFSSAQNARKFLQETLDQKDFEYAYKSYRRLCDQYSVRDVEANLFRLMGIVDEVQWDFSNETKNQYNQKWQKLSNLIDRISQVTIIPGFILFAVSISVIAIDK